MPASPGFLYVRLILPGSPAAKSNSLRIGDRIVAYNHLYISEAFNLHVLGTSVVSHVSLGVNHVFQERAIRIRKSTPGTLTMTLNRRAGNN